MKTNIMKKINVIKPEIVFEDFTNQHMFRSNHIPHEIFMSNCVSSISDYVDYELIKRFEYHSVDKYCRHIEDLVWDKYTNPKNGINQYIYITNKVVETRYECIAQVENFTTDSGYVIIDGNKYKVLEIGHNVKDDIQEILINNTEVISSEDIKQDDVELELDRVRDDVRNILEKYTEKVIVDARAEYIRVFSYENYEDKDQDKQEGLFDKIKKWFNRG